MDQLQLFKLAHHGLEFGGLKIRILFDAFACRFARNCFFIRVCGGTLFEVDGTHHVFEFGAAEGRNS